MSWVKQIAILTMMVTFVINPVFACCHPDGNSNAYNLADNTGDQGDASHSGCHDETATPVGGNSDSHGSQDLMDCSGCVSCDAYFQKISNATFTAIVVEAPSLEDVVEYKATLEGGIPLWTVAGLKPPGRASPVVLSPFELSDILII